MFSRLCAQNCVWSKLCDQNCVLKNVQISLHLYFQNCVLKTVLGWAHLWVLLNFRNFGNWCRSLSLLYYELRVSTQFHKAFFMSAWRKVLWTVCHGMWNLWKPSLGNEISPDTERWSGHSYRPCSHGDQWFNYQMCYLFVIKSNNFQGDLTDVLATTK